MTSRVSSPRPSAPRTRLRSTSSSLVCSTDLRFLTCTKHKANRVLELEDVEKALKQLSGGEEKRQVLDLGVGANVNVLKRDEGLLDSLSLDNIIKRDDEGITGDLLGGILKRDDAISSLAGQLLPKLTSGGILPKDLSADQLTGLLKVLDVNNLLTGVEGLVQGLLGGLPLKGLTGNLL